MRVALAAAASRRLVVHGVFAACWSPPTGVGTDLDGVVCMWIVRIGSFRRRVLATTRANRGVDGGGSLFFIYSVEQRDKLLTKERSSIRCTAEQSELDEPS